jgi:ArsR family transcriptional regulator, arsenate/arsenite/antimonite-responsive transcriptional repressor
VDREFIVYRRWTMNSRFYELADESPESTAMIAGRLAALSHPVRIEILKHLSGSRYCCCKDVVERLDLAQSTVSQHLKILVDAGFVRFESDNRRSRYELDREALTNLSASIAVLVEKCCSRR